MAHNSGPWPAPSTTSSPRATLPSSDELLGRFLDYVAAQGPRRSIRRRRRRSSSCFEGKNVILNTPTGSGKSLVASALHFASLAHGRRSVYTCPIKALVNEKWMALCREFGPENVGLSTGDATVNRDAPDPLLHGRDPRQHRAARGRGRARSTTS